MRKGLCFYIISSISLFFFITLKSQTSAQNSDRIPAVIPSCVIQDSFDFIWIADQEGLIRYDGYISKRFKTIPFDTTSLSANFVKDIKEDRKGNLWITTFGGGLNYFDQKTEVFTHFLDDPDASASLGSNTLNKIIVNNDGSLWIGTQDNGFTFMDWDSAGNPVYKQYTDHNLPPDIPIYTILDLYKDKNGYLWIGSVGMGLQRLNIASGEIKSYQHNPQNPASISHNFVSSICEDDLGNLWVGTGFPILNDGAGLNMFDRKTEKFTHYRHKPGNPASLNSDIITFLKIDRDDHLWIGTNRNRMQYIALKELYENQSPKFKNAEDRSVSFLYEDRLGNMWVAPKDFYVKKYNNQQNPFHYLKHKPGNPNSLSHSSGYSLFLDNEQNLWIGHTRKGITRYNLETKQYKHYAHDPKNPNSLSENRIRSICEDNDGQIWIGTDTRGISILNPENDSFTHIKANVQDTTALYSNLIWWLIKSNNGDIWIAHNKGGLQLYDAEHKRFIRYDVDPNSIEDEAIYSICEDHSGKLWVGTWNNGLYGITLKNRKIENVEHLTYNPDDTLGLTSNVIIHIINDVKKNALWITTDGGLNYFDLNTGIIDHVTTKDGLSSNFLLNIIQDNSGNLWFTTPDGISRYNPQNGKIINYDKADGLPHTKFGGITKRTVKAPDGHLFFGALGVIAFDPQKIIDNPNIPPIRLTDFKIFNESVRLDTAIQFKKNIILNHKQNAFSFEFSALNFTNPVKNQYAYKMEGFLDDWIYIGTERTASFTNLDPGNYTFRVKGSNNHGIWNEEGASVIVTILPPWWATTWAYLVYILMIISLLYTMWHFQLKKYQLKQELQFQNDHSKKLLEIDHMKSQFFANISHEFRTPLTLILGPIEKLLSKSTDLDSRNELSMMQRNANRLKRLINQLLDLSKLETGNMTFQVSEVNIVELVHNYIQSFESLAKQKGIELKFSSEENIIPVFVDKDKFEEILNNLLSNAFKFTNEGGTVEVTIKSGIFAKTNSEVLDHIKIKITDTGIGIPSNRLDHIFDRFYQVDGSQKREHEGSGIGLALTKELVELHHGRIDVESELGKGTSFTILLPKGKEHFKEAKILEESKSGSSIVLEKEMEQAETNHIYQTDHLDILLNTKKEKSSILIIEDNHDMRSYICGILDNSHNIIEASNGSEGFSKAIKYIPNLIVSDVMMPEMDGFELCKKLKTEERTSHIPIILLTARAAHEDKIEGLELGADDYLSKPFDSEELLIRIKNLINYRKTLREKFKKDSGLGFEYIAHTSADSEFAKKVFGLVSKNISDSNFNLETLADEVGMSRMNLHRKIQGLFGQSPGELIRTIRLKKAAELIKKQTGNISEIAYDVGFENPANFSTSFRNQFGISPSEFLKNHKAT